MKIYNETQKSWAIKLRGNLADERTCFLCAVDSQTGESLCPLIVFHKDGMIERLKNVEGILRNKGYDPQEHGNSFDVKGRIFIN